jgi:quercetin dioxygenase-like cupin family protein
MQALKDARPPYEVEHRAEHAARPGFRITELRISKARKVPWHYHNNVQDTFYVLQGIGEYGFVPLLERDVR